MGFFSLPFPPWFVFHCAIKEIWVVASNLWYNGIDNSPSPAFFKKVISFEKAGEQRLVVFYKYA